MNYVNNALQYNTENASQPTTTVLSDLYISPAGGL